MTIFNETVEHTLTITHSVDWHSVGFYGTVGNGNAYFDNKLNVTAWTGASTADKERALKQATLDIDKLNFKGFRYSTTQSKQFPRGDDTLVPKEIEYACYEQAIKLLAGETVEDEVKNLRVLERQFDVVKTRYNPSAAASAHIRAGILSVTAWNFLRPFLRDPQTMYISRM